MDGAGRESEARFAACVDSLAGVLGHADRAGPLLDYCTGLLMPCDSQPALAQQNPLTAIDIALEPDATMLQRARHANARLLKAFPEGFALDASHQPHVNMLQQFVRTADLDKVYAAANAVLAKERPASWTLKAIKTYYIPSPPLGLAGIVVEPTEDLHTLQDALIAAVAPYTAKNGNRGGFLQR